MTSVPIKAYYHPGKNKLQPLVLRHLSSAGALGLYLLLFPYSLPLIILLIVININKHINVLIKAIVGCGNLKQVYLCGTDYKLKSKRVTDYIIRS